MIQSIVFQDDKDGLWYFWEENWAFRRGGFKTRKDAYEALEEYCKRELGADVSVSHVIKETDNVSA